MGFSIDRFLAEKRGRPLTVEPDETPATPQATPVEKTREFSVDDWLASRNGTTAKVTAQIQSGTTDTPKSTKVLQLESQTGLAPDLIDRNLSDVQSQVWRKDFQANSATDYGPKLKGWLAENPYHVAAASPDLTRLNWLERQVQSVKDQYHASVTNNRINDLAARDFDGTITPAETSELNSLESLNANQPKDADYNLGFGPVSNFIAGIPGKTAGFIPLIPKLAVAGVTGGLQGAGAGAAFGAMAGAAASAPTGEIAAPVAVPVTAGVGAAVGFARGAETAVLAEMAKQGTYSSFRQYSKLKDDQGKPLSRETAKALSVGTGVVGAALMSLKLGTVLNAAKGAPFLRSLGPSAVARALSQPTIRGALTRIAESTAESGGTWAGISWLQSMVNSTTGELAQMANDTKDNATLDVGTVFGRVFSDEHLDAAKEAARAGAQTGIGVGLAGSAVPAANDVRRAIQAKQNVKFFERLGAATTDSHLSKELPDKLQEVVDRLTKDGPVETLHAPVDTWNSYWQSQNLDPAEVAEKVTGSADAYNQAVSAGHDIEIPTARYAKFIAPTEHNRFFVNELRLSPEQMNGRESDAYAKTLVEQEKAQTEAAAAVPETDVEAAAKAVEDRLTAEGVATGKFDEETWRTAVESVYGHGFRELVLRHGEPLENVKRVFSRVFISKGEAPPLRESTVGEAIAPIVEANIARATERGRIADEAGRFADARTSAGTRRPIERVSNAGLLSELRDYYNTKIQQAGERAVYQFTPDENAHTMNVPGTSVMHGGKRDASGVTPQAKALRNLEDYTRITAQIEKELESRGIQQDQINEAIGMDEAQFAERYGANASPADEARNLIYDETGKELFQSAVALHSASIQSPAFLAWFGNSKIVDSNGDPLVLFHQTHESSVAPIGQEGFDLGRVGARGSDDGVPDGIFMKPDSRDIGVGAAKVAEIAQIPLYASIKNPLVVADRAALTKHLSQDMEYAVLAHEVARIDRNVATGYDQMEAAEKRKENGRFERAFFDRADAFLKDGRIRINAAAAEARARATEVLRAEGYDGVVIFRDAGSMGRATKTIIALDPTQVKHATDNIGTFDTKSPGILYQSAPRAVADLTLQRISEGMGLSAVARDALAAEGHDQSVGGEALVNRGGGASELFRNLLEGVALDPESNGVLSVPSLAAMLAHVRRAAFDDPQVLDAIVGAVPVDMVNNLFGSETAAKVALHDEPMFQHGTTFNADLPIAEGVNATNPIGLLLGEVARQGAEASAVALRARLEAPEGGAAAVAGERNRFSQGAPEGKRRASISFGPNGEILIKLMEEADLSSFIHESGHFYTEVLSELGKTNESIAKDLQILRDHVGAKGDEKLTREQHETIARSFEAYLMEGKAPSTELRGAFARMKAWMLLVYKSLSSLNVNLTPEVRGVFDRLMASDEEIQRAEESVPPLFPDPKALDMSEEKAARYETALREAHDAAQTRLEQKALAEVKREQSRQWKLAREKVRASVAEEVNADPAWRALSIFQRGTLPDGTELPEGVEPIKLDRQSIIDMYGGNKEVLKTLPRPYVYAKEGGVHPDMAAEMFGFASGDALIKALPTSETPRDRIERLTTDRMKQQFGDIMTDGRLAVEALNAVHSADRAKVLRMELQHLASNDLAVLKGLTRKITGRIPDSEVVRREAERIVSTKKNRDVKPNTYAVAERKAQRAATEALLRGDVQKAFDEKLKEQFNNELYRSAVGAQEMIAGVEQEVRQLFRPDKKLALTRDMDFVNAARAVATAYGLGRGETNPRAFLKQIESYDPENYESINKLVEDALPVQGQLSDFKEATVEEVATMHDAIRALWNLSRRSRQSEIDGVKVDRQALQDEMTARIHEITPEKPKAEYTKAATNWEKSKRTLMSGRSWLRRVEHWVDAMDGADNPNGPFRRYLFNPISEAATKYRMAKRGTLEKYLAIVQSVEKDMEGGVIHSPELAHDFANKAELLGAMLHTGNESNLDKLLRGRQWSSDRFQNFVARMQQEGVLTKLHYDYLQGVWDLFEELKPNAQKAHRDMYGYYFSEITAKPFENQFGKYRGGYYPAKVDPFLVQDVAAMRQREELLGTDNSFMFPTTGRGFTKTRIESYARPLILDAAYVPSGLDAVLRFTHIEPRVRDVARMVTSRTFRAELNGFDPTVASDMLVPWLQRAAQQKIDVPGKFPAFDKFWRGVRSRSAMQVMSASVSTALQMVGHAPAAMVKIGGENWAGSLWRYVRDPKGFSADIVDKSDFMRTRETAGVTELRQSIDRLLLDPSTYQKARDFAREHGYFLTHGVQNVIDLVTWGGAYDEAIGKGMNEGAAIRSADSIVRETQGSFAPEDVSRFEANTPFIRMFSMFYSFFNTKANLLGTEFTKTVRDTGLKKGAGRMLGVYTWGFMIPAVLAGLTRHLASGKPLDKDDDGPTDDIFRLFFGSQWHMMNRMVPFVGPVVESATDWFQGHDTTDEIGSSPAIKAIESTARVPGDVYRAIHAGITTHREINDVLTLVGILSGFPAGALARPLGYISDVRQGKARPSSPLDYGRGLVTGQRGQ